MIVSGIVGSVDALLISGVSAFSVTRKAMWVVSPLIEPNMAQTLSSIIHHLDDLVAGLRPRLRAAASC